MWRRIWLVAAREYLANVKTKTFVIAILTFPVILGIASSVPFLLQRARVSAKPFVVLDQDESGLVASLRRAFDGASEINERFEWRAPAQPIASIEQADRLVASGELFAYIVIPFDAVESGRATYAAQNLANRGLHRWFDRQFRGLVRERRFEAAGVDVRTRDQIMGDVELEQRKIDEAGTGTRATDFDKIRAYAPMVFVYLLFVAVITVAQMLLMNVIEEKATRVIEVLLSSVSPQELMAGKISGVAATGLTMVGAWGVCGLGYVRWGVPLLIGDGNSDLGAQIFDLAWSLMGARNLTFFALYGLLGFLLFSAIFAAIGSLFESIKEAQNLQTPVIMVLMVPVLTMTFVTENPHETLGKVLSWIPPFTPFVMMNRVAAMPPAPLAEVIGTLLVLLGSVGVAYWLAGRVFRVGILMTGKSPTPRELWRILRGG